MVGRTGMRARTDFQVRASAGSALVPCRGVELSTTGVVIDRGRGTTERDHRLLVQLELSLAERTRPIRAVARSVWTRGPLQAFRFVRIADADRLNLAEHLDLVALRGGALA